MRRSDSKHPRHNWICYLCMCKIVVSESECSKNLFLWCIPSSTANKLTWLLNLKFLSIKILRSFTFWPLLIWFPFMLWWYVILNFLFVKVMELYFKKLINRLFCAQYSISRSKSSWIYLQSSIVLMRSNSLRLSA